MADIFDNVILCKDCGKKMEKGFVERDGFKLRVVECKKCSNNKVVHPQDLQEYQDFQHLKKKDFRVKLRFVGNSYAVSIPREIVDFIKEQEKVMDDMVRLCFDDAKRLSLNFGN
jgi:hypothetical protein